MTADVTDAIFAVALATVEFVGPTPNDTAAAREHIRKWIQLMRRHDAKLAALTDAEIANALEQI